MKSKILELSAIIFVVALILFSIKQIEYKLCTTIVLVVVSVLKFKYDKNRTLLNKISLATAASVLLGFFVAYLINKSKWYSFDRWDTVATMLIIVIGIALCVNSDEYEAEECENEYELFEQQIHDIKRIKEYIDNFDIIGINGMWGSGKSFLIKHLQNQQEMIDKYIFIKIDLLSCNLDQIQDIIYDAIGRVLSNNGIYSQTSRQIKKLLSGGRYIQRLLPMVQDDNISYSMTLDILKDELNNLDKTVIIVYEDIDRINEKAIVQKLFSISEQLVCDKIKIIYEYDNDNIEKMGLDREYMEKYIPYIINLTPIPLKNVAKLFLGQENIENDVLTLNDLELLSKDVMVHIHKWSRNVKSQIVGCNIRKIKHFIFELTNALKENEEYRKDENKKIVIIFFALKHFEFDVYNQLAVNESMLNIKWYKYKDEFYDTTDLICYLENEKAQSRITKSDIFDEHRNVKLIYWIAQFGYSLRRDENIDRRELENYYAEELSKYERLNRNEKIDRIIWSLLCMGKSEFTNRELAVKKFTNEVLNVTKEKQENAFKKFNDEIFHGEFDKHDNTTIHLIGVKQFRTLFEAYYVCCIVKEDWIKLIDFYFEHIEQNITPDVIATLKCCSIYYNSVYVHVLRKFNKLKVIGNFNAIEYYKDFLLEYLSHLQQWGCDYEPEWYGSGSKISDDKDCFLNQLERLKIALNTKKDIFPFKDVHDDIDAAIEFIDKNINIINNPVSLRVESPSRFETSLKSANSEAIESLKTEKGNIDFEKNVIEKYRTDEITLSQVERLIK